MRSKNILLISYYWPPLGGASVQRWLKFIKYLDQLGYKCYVYTPENPSFDTIDNSLQYDISDDISVLKSIIWEPHSIFGNTKKTNSSNSKTSSSKTIKNKIGHWIRGNIFIPDSRVFWVKPSVKKLTSYIQKHDIQNIITTGPPHSMHLIGLGLKKKVPKLNWIADFRDPWSEWEKYLNEFYPTALSKLLNKRLEKKVLQSANKVLTISPTYVDRLQLIAGRKIELLRNGFDEENFKNYTKNIDQSNFIIRHIGTIDLRRNPIPFLEKLDIFISSNPTTKNVIFEFIGNVENSLKREIENRKWNFTLTFIEYVPHSEIINYYSTSSALVLILATGTNAKGNIPGKLFEYLASNTSIIGIGDSKGDSANIINETESGKVFEPNQSQSDFNESIDLIINNKITATENQSYKKYSRLNLTKELIKIIES